MIFGCSTSNDHWDKSPPRHIGSPVSFRPFSIPTRKASPVSSSHNTSMAVTWNSRWAPSYVEGRSLEGINDVALSHAAQIVLVEEGAAEADGVNLGEDHLGTHKFTHARKNNTKTKHTQVNFYKQPCCILPGSGNSKVILQKEEFLQERVSSTEWHATRTKITVTTLVLPTLRVSQWDNKTMVIWVPKKLFFGFFISAWD